LKEIALVHFRDAKFSFFQKKIFFCTPWAKDPRGSTAYPQKIEKIYFVHVHLQTSPTSKMSINTLFTSLVGAMNKLEEAIFSEDKPNGTVECLLEDRELDLGVANRSELKGVLRTAVIDLFRKRMFRQANDKGVAVEDFSPEDKLSIAAMLGNGDPAVKGEPAKRVRGPRPPKKAKKDDSSESEEDSADEDFVPSKKAARPKKKEESESEEEKPKKKAKPEIEELRPKKPKGKKVESDSEVAVEKVVKAVEKVEVKEVKKAKTPSMSKSPKYDSDEDSSSGEEVEVKSSKSESDNRKDFISRMAEAPSSP